MTSFRVALTIVLLSLSSIRVAAEDRKGLDFFEAKIRPMLVKHCYQCHSAKAAAAGKLKGGLLLDTRDRARRGGESGPAVVPENSEESLLISALRHDAFEMPPNGKLPDGIIADFVKWIEMGAPDPREGETITGQEIDIEEGKQFWSFQPLWTGAAPEIEDAGWARTDIDRFIRARQEIAGVEPNDVAPAPTLVRRAYFDLTGLPPSPEDLNKWVGRISSDGASSSQAWPSINHDAYAEMIDHLLGSAHYGERWGRHWLDLVRFAESNGYAFDGDRPNAYHYRDIVIRAFNADMPYDEFVRLQVAGDLLADPDQTTSDGAREALRKIAATGFLVAGPYTTQQTQKERERSRYEQLDDMVHTMGTAFLGLTLGCSRCHSHKYDPLPQHDYYRLAACFAEVGFVDAGINLKPESYLAAKTKYDKQHTLLAGAVARFEQEQLLTNFAAWLNSEPDELPAPTIGDWQHIGPFAAGNFNEAYDKAFEPESEIDLAQTYNDGKLKWTEQPSWEDGKAHNTLSGDNSANYLYRVIETPVARKVQISLGSDDGIKVWINGSEILAKKVGGGAAPDQQVIELPLKKGRNELLMKIVNGDGGSGFYFKSSRKVRSKEMRALFEMQQDRWNDEQRKKVAQWYRTIDEKWLDLSAEVREHKKQQPKPEITNVFSARVRGSSYKFGDDTYKVYFLGRGNADRKQGLATPGFLQVLMRGDEKPWFEKVTTSPGDANKDETTANQQAGRLALADWLADTENGAGNLLARVLVNRLWLHHFGRGIVATPSDFGSRGERPSHPELLDWLAGRLLQNGWKIKSLHRQIMTSAVYMQAGGATESGQNSDPENLLFWRREPRRLEAEIIRDTVLAVSGTLDHTMYGKGVLDQNNPRRSIYLTVKRSQLIPLLKLFDAPDTMSGVGSREESTVAPQALALLNSPFARELATKFAARVRPNADTSIDDLISQAYRIALSRSPTEGELALMREFIRRQTVLRGTEVEAEMLAVRDFCHLLLCMNEFVYVD